MSMVKINARKDTELFQEITGDDFEEFYVNTRYIVLCEIIPYYGNTYTIITLSNRVRLLCQGNGDDFLV